MARERVGKRIRQIARPRHSHAENKALAVSVFERLLKLIVPPDKALRLGEKRRALVRDLHAGGGAREERDVEFLLERLYDAAEIRLVHVQSLRRAADRAAAPHLDGTS